MHKLELISEYVGRTVAWLVSAMVAITFLVVVLRYAFNYGRIDLQELTLYLHAIVLMLGMSYTMRCDQHVRVDILYQRFSPSRCAYTNLVGNIVFLIPVCVALLIISWDYVAISWKVMERSAETGGLPFLFLIKSLTPAMAILLIIQAIADSAARISVIRKYRI